MTNVLLQAALEAHSSTRLSTLDRNKAATWAQYLCSTRAEGAEWIMQRLERDGKICEVKTYLSDVELVNTFYVE
jgi:hypothetical protein